MKRNLTRIAAALGTVFIAASPFTAYAAEADNTDELVIKLEDLNMEVVVPDFYEFVFDRTQSYRGDLGAYGIDVNAAMESLEGANTFFEALYIDNDYFSESYMTYKLSDTDFKNLKVLSDEDLDQFGKSAAISATMQGYQNNLKATFDGVYKDGNGIPYVSLQMTFTHDENGDGTSYCLGTIVDGKGYYYYTRSYAPETTMDSLKESTEALVEDVTYYNAYKAEEEILDNAAAESTSTPQTLTQDEYVQEQLDRLKDNPNSNKKMGDIWKEQEEAQKKANIFFLIGKWTARGLLAVFVIIIITVINKIKTKKAEKQWYNEHGTYNNDDSNGSY